MYLTDICIISCTNLAVAVVFELLLFLFCAADQEEEAHPEYKFGSDLVDDYSQKEAVAISVKKVRLLLTCISLEAFHGCECKRFCFVEASQHMLSEESNSRSSLDSLSFKYMRRQNFVAENLSLIQVEY